MNSLRNIANVGIIGGGFIGAAAALTLGLSQSLYTGTLDKINTV
ncbi:unnamed protein product [Schistosoma mattheei]|uniref:Uncharacterized protein n=1 Tax=Schistosoma mattheei TaxID=31246 RepID=A0A183Q7D3_9TREM|nr:unnamed protein product [Schistosoma mattheei]